MQQITLRIPEDTLQAVESAAEERGVSRSEYIREHLANGASPTEHAALQREHAELQPLLLDVGDEFLSFLAAFERRLQLAL